MSGEIIDSTANAIQVYEKLGISGVSFILFIIMGIISYFLLKKILDNFDSMKTVMININSMEDLFKGLKQEFATNNELIRHMIEEQKNSNAIYLNMIEKSIIELRKDISDLKERAFYLKDKREIPRDSSNCYHNYPRNSEL